MTTQTAHFSGSLLLATVMEPKEIGQRLKAAREAKHLSQLELALLANVSPSSVSRWERGFLPKVRELMRVAELLDLDPKELVELAPTDDHQVAALREEVAALRASVNDGGEQTVKALEALRKQVRALARSRAPEDPPTRKRAAH